MKTVKAKKIMFDFGSGKVLAHQHKNPDGTKGGWVANTATVEKTAYIGPDAQVFGKAQVFDSARVFGSAQVFGSARVFGLAWVFDLALVFGNARVYGSARVFGLAWVSGKAKVTHNPCVVGDLLPYNITITDNHIQVGCVQVLLADIPKLTVKKAAKLHSEGPLYLDAVKDIVKAYMKHAKLNKR